MLCAIPVKRKNAINPALCHIQRTNPVNIQGILHDGAKTSNLFLSSKISFFIYHKKIKFISSNCHVIFSLLHMSRLFLHKQQCTCKSGK